MLYCTENLGKRDPNYGGVLADISTLPLGAKFHVCNGNWNGQIIMHENLKSIAIFSADVNMKSPMKILPLRDNPEENILSIKIL